MPNLTDNPGFTGNNNQTTNNGRTTMEDILKSQTEYLKSIDDTLNNLLKNGASFSQSAARDFTPRRDDFSGSRSSFKNTKSTVRNKAGSVFDRFTDSLEDALIESFIGSDFKSSMKSKFNDIAKSMGKELDDLPSEFGKLAGQIIADKIKNSGPIGDKLRSHNMTKSADVADWFSNGVKSAYSRMKDIPGAFDKGRQAAQSAWSERNPEKAAALSSLRSQYSARKEQDDFRQSKIAELTNAINLKYADAVRMEEAQPVNIVGAQVALPVYIQSETEGPGILSKAGDVFDYLTAKNDELFGNSDKGISSVSDIAEDALKDKFGVGNIVDDSLSSITTKMSQFGSVSEGAAGMIGGLKGAAGTALGALGKVVPQMLAVYAATKALEVGIWAVKKYFQMFSDQFKPAIEGLKQFGETLKSTANRTHDEQDQMLENAQKRLEEDAKTMVETPFKILEDAAQKLYDTWDTNIREINQTQGYNKEDLQSLIGSYAQRLRDENLSSVVSSADITENLTKVLESGLSGQVAEEFAYLATKLNAAIPTQDFFQYADAYASLAATAIQNGQSEAEAINYANTQLEAFANNILYASRQISGGFSTGLKNANELFEQSVKIAQTGRSTNVTEISGVMASVSAIVGAVAPDLASSITDMIYNAATGGNTSQIVALRSLAGINASNTEFLREFTQNPKAVFTELFENLANMQQMSPDNYMEVAEGLADVFGVSMDALARVDFNYLAQAISEMNVNSSSLAENLQLLASGESTTTAEQMRMQQINEYMIDEGLAYVMDNEAARAIQQHMWDEQIANEIMEATYGVELTGSAAEAIQGIKQTVDNIIGFLIPFIGIGRALTNIATTTAEAVAQRADIVQSLELGKVGEGNKSDLYNLITRGQNLNLTPDYVTLQGGRSLYGIANTVGNALQTSWSSFRDLDLTQKLVQAGLKAYDRVNSSYSGPTSMYNWGVVGKSTASTALGGLAGGTATGSIVSTVQNATKSAQAQAQGKLDKYMSTDYMQGFVDEGKSFEDYFKAADRALGGKFEDQLDDAGIQRSQLESQFQSLQTQKGAQEAAERQQREEDFWKNTQDYLLQTIELFNYQNQVLEEFYKKHTEFYDAWVDYFVKHTAYSAAYNHSDVTKIQIAERSGSEDAVYALAEALTKNAVDLLDPTIQTNALLSQILIVVNAIMQQNNKTGAGLSLPDTLSGLALGIVKQT